jgi:RimJ/RimL family protein N-acetyltransferase
MAKVSLRPADRHDEQMIFGWRNDPWIVERGISRKTVTFEEHRNWFENVLKDSNVRLFIIEHDDEPIGQVRVHRLNPEEGEITAYLTRENTGRGLGVEAIRQGCATAFETWALRRIFARVLSGNAQSLRAFEKAGFFLSNNPRDDDYFELVLESINPVTESRGRP